MLLGDINTDGAVHIGDRQLLSEHIVGKALLSGEQRENADANFDGKVDIADLVVVALRSRLCIIQEIEFCCCSGTREIGVETE